MGIVLLIFGLLSQIAIGVFTLLDMMKKRAVYHIIILVSTGVQLLAVVFLVIGAEATTIIGQILALLGALAFATGYALLIVSRWAKPPGVVQQQ